MTPKVIVSFGRNLNDFLGNANTKKEVSDIVKQMLNPQLFMMYGTQPDRSFLFHGPPGNGKTLATHCIGGELELNNKVFAILPYDIGNYGTAYINMGSRNLQDFFNLGKDAAMDPNCDGVIYLFDEAEVIMGKRGDRLGTKEDDKLLDTLMKNQQRIFDEGNNEYIIFMTNFKDAMDQAALRTNRIDKQIEFKDPDKVARENLLQYEIDRTNRLVGYKMIKRPNIPRLVVLTKGFNCADVADLPRRAVKNAVLEMLEIDLGKVLPSLYINQKYLERQISGFNKVKEKKVGFK